jgi:ligand-binding sensor domain-containing protein/signal transduction histidine kinase
VYTTNLRLKRLPISRPIPFWIFLLLYVAPLSLAVEPTTHVSQYAHTAWRIQDGVFSGAPNAIAQTADGYLWVGTQNGLVRFDGVRFVPWSSPNSKLPSNAVFSLLPEADGSLWIGTGVNLAHLKDGELASYGDDVGRVNAILKDHNGKVWIARSRVRDNSGPLCEAENGEIRCKGKADGLTVPFAGPLAEDLDGNLWVGCPGVLMRWKAGSATAFRPPGFKGVETLSGIQALAVTQDGSIWSGINRRGRGLGLQRLVQGVWKSFTSPELNGEDIEVNALFVDRHDTLWVGTTGQGIYRINKGKAERFSSNDGLSGNSITSFYEDHEGNLWVVTTEGIDSFRDIPVMTFSTREGLAVDDVYSVLAARDGTVWIGDHDSLGYLRGDKLDSIRFGKGLPGHRVTSLLEDHAGTLWVGLDDNLYTYEEGRFNKIRSLKGDTLGTIIALTEDRNHDVWAEALGTPWKLVRIQQRKVQEEFSIPGMPNPSSLAADPAGGIWLAGANGLAHYRDEHFETYFVSPTQIIKVQQIIVRHDGSVLGTSPVGLVYWSAGTLRTLTSQNGLPCDDLYSLVSGADDAIWLYTQCGLVRLPDTELQKWWNDSHAVVRVETFDVFDGARPWSTPFEPQASRSPDGRLWFANETVMQMIDPRHLSKNTISPPVHVEEVIADHKSYSLKGRVVLPALTRDLEIDYTAPSFTVPQKVRFRYQLEGKDRSWQEPGTRRQAFYNDLRPGRYRFHVIASNKDGVWNQDGATLDFDISAAWFQTTWFRVLCAIAAVWIIWSLYRYRVRQVAGALSIRFDERLAERTRMAQELHDTFLQTVQASKLVADDALDHANDPNQTRRALEKVSQWLGRAAEEGRAALHSLRTSTTEENNLAEGFRRALEECRKTTGMEAVFSVTGNVREMHPVVRDEVYRIGYEAIRNAYTHSGGRRVEVSLSYGDDLSLRVHDDGSGIAADILATGKVGHFGLPGMRERAARIGAHLTITSSTNSGTEIKVVVPGRIVFQKLRVAPLDRIKTIFKRAG